MGVLSGIHLLPQILPSRLAIDRRQWGIRLLGVRAPDASRRT